MAYQADPLDNVFAVICSSLHVLVAFFCLLCGSVAGRSPFRCTCFYSVLAVERVPIGATIAALYFPAPDVKVLAGGAREEAEQGCGGQPTQRILQGYPADARVSDGHARDGGKLAFSFTSYQLLRWFLARGFAVRVCVHATFLRVGCRGLRGVRLFCGVALSQNEHDGHNRFGKDTQKAVGSMNRLQTCVEYSHESDELHCCTHFEPRTRCNTAGVFCLLVS